MQLPLPDTWRYRFQRSGQQKPMMCYFVKLVNNNNKVFNGRPCSYYSVSFSLLLRSSVSTEDPIVILRFLFKVFRFQWKTSLLFLFYSIVSFSLLFSYPTQPVAEGIMFLTRPSVSLSVLFFLSAQFL